MKKIYISIFIIALAASVALAGEFVPKIKIVTSGVNIGEIQKGKTLAFKIEVKNRGAGDLVIENVYSSCGCLEVTDQRWANQNIAPEPVNVKPDESIFIDVRLDTNKLQGSFEKQLHIISNDPETKDAVWEIKGVVLDSADLPPRLNSIAEESAGPAQSFSSETAEDSQVGKPAPDSKIIMLFYSPGCGECIEIKDNFFPGLKEKYGDKIWVEEYNIDNPQNFAILLDMQNKYDKKTKKVFFNPRPPAVFAEGRLLYGVKGIKNKLEGILSLKAN